MDVHLLKRGVEAGRDGEIPTVFCVCWPLIIAEDSMYVLD